MTPAPRPVRGHPTRVLMVTPRFYPDAGGIQTHVREVGERITGTGVKVDVLTTDAAGRLPRRERIGSLDVTRVRAWPRGRDYYVAPGVARVIASGNWDLVHCQGVHTFVAPIAMLAARRARRPYVVSFHTGGHSTALRHRLRAIQWRVLRPLLSGACRLVAVSQYEADLFTAILRPRAGQLVVVPNGVRPMAPVGAPAVGGDTTILSIGRLERYKGHHRLIAALPELVRRVPDARATILGTGPYEAELRALARRLAVEDRVTISSVAAGDPEAMAERIARSRLVVLLSEYEAHPVSLLEAASVGRPVLVAMTSGLTELVDAGIASGIPLDATPEDTAAAIASALGVAPSPADLPTWDDTAAALLGLYQACVGAAA